MKVKVKLPQILWSRPITKVYSEWIRICRAVLFYSPQLYSINDHTKVLLSTVQSKNLFYGLYKMLYYYYKVLSTHHKNYILQWKSVRSWNIFLSFNKISRCYSVFRARNTERAAPSERLQRLLPQMGMSQSSMGTPSSSVKHQGASCWFPGLRQYECPPLSSG